MKRENGNYEPKNEYRVTRTFGQALNSITLYQNYKKRARCYRKLTFTQSVAHTSARPCSNKPIIPYQHQSILDPDGQTSGLKRVDIVN